MIFEDRHLLYPGDTISIPTKKEWLIPAVLIFLSIVPLLAGAHRLLQLHGGVVTEENARFFAAPVPVTLHILSVTLYSLLGAFQFAPGFRKRHLAYHRVAGKILVPLGFTVALTGLWMAQFYPWIKYDGFYLYLIRLAVGSAMTLFLALSIAAIQKRKFLVHGAWMMRAYALALGAGTQVFTHIPWFVFPSIHGEFFRTVFMAEGWLLNILIAEWIIRKKPEMVGVGRSNSLFPSLNSE